MASVATSVDWNTLIDEEVDEGKPVCVTFDNTDEDDDGGGSLDNENTPPSSPESGQMDENVGSIRLSEDDSQDVLKLYCNDQDLFSIEDLDETKQSESHDNSRRKQRRPTTTKRAATCKAVGRLDVAVRKRRKQPPPQSPPHGDRPDWSSTTSTKADRSVLGPKTGRKTRGRPRHSPPQQHGSRRQKTGGGGGSWIARWIRTGYEHLVFDVCNSNEAPNVVFAGLCYRQADIYSMVLRNCNGKRRYWYEKFTRDRRALDGVRVSDFERAMVWRANAVGRACTSPGYDLAAFVLQNVTTDKRYASAPLIVVTTDNMLDDVSVRAQLSSTNGVVGNGAVQTLPAPFSNRRPERLVCCECHDPAQIVTHDNASVPTYTCWQHAASYMTTASADRTRVCSSVIMDVQFRNDNFGPVCQLRLLNCAPGSHQKVSAIAEFVFVPVGTKPSDIVMQQNTVQEPCEVSTKEYTMDLESSHAFCCRDGHFNPEDLFPSIPNNRGGVAMYDTTIGRVVDLVYCIAGALQT